ncbi:AraC family transcriptional regulator [Pedobacter chinensis]|uniref:AraC family transcriptional regulator n=1 Tax=Pedobacter chinensis TaxID=2282421 RepID=A0A369Q0R9_9SPHI|nr:AraC family transcriptional regulator [Pedobacter chinensis]RDC56519.1 AraC family transcriptional regulator [Pedobacter chinensis]
MEHKIDNVAQYGTRFDQILGSDMQNIEIKFLKSYDFLPELMLHFGSFIVKKSFVRETATWNGIWDGISFHFYNTFEYNNQNSSKRKIKKSVENPYVRVFPVALSQKIPMTKDTQSTHLSIAISADYLKTFLRDDAKHFEFLFDSSNIFLIEEIMTDNILNTVNDIAKQDEQSSLKSYYYKLKAMELLFYLFESLRKREKSVHQKLNDREIKSIYKVRDKIVSSLSKPSTITDLTKIAGMNELKMRKIFTQVFGMGIYDYYQHLRMKEAARLLRDEKLSVSEAGYQMGFENLSHFTRVFEKHIGKKPKKYSSEFM